MSICIPVYNRVHYLPRLLESILNQTFTDFEIVVSDNSCAVYTIYNLSVVN